MCGTELVYRRQCASVWYAYRTQCTSVSNAMCGTELAYGAPRSTRAGGLQRSLTLRSVDFAVSSVPRQRMLALNTGVRGTICDSDRVCC
eukprot:2724881-Rhodomonas_salina.7